MIDTDPWVHGRDLGEVRTGGAEAPLDEAAAADGAHAPGTSDAALVPPQGRVPTIVLGRRGMNVAPAPAVQIDVATPGLDQAGHFFRGDAVVAVRLRQVAATDLPAAAEVIDRIGAAVGPVGDC